MDHTIRTNPLRTMEKTKVINGIRLTLVNIRKKHLRVVVGFRLFPR